MYIVIGGAGMVGAGLARILRDNHDVVLVDIDEDRCAEVYAERQEVKRLLDPDGMGADFKVLVQGRGAAVAAAARALRQPV